MSILMSLLDDMNRMAMPPSYWEQQPSMYWMPRRPSRMQDMLMPVNTDGHEGKVTPYGKDGFQVSMDVAQFKPNEIMVKVVENAIVVEGKHEEREDNHGYITRHFARRYVLPKDYDANKVTSTLSSDGVLTVSVPKPHPVADKSNERIVQIQQTGPAHLNVKHNPKDDGKTTTSKNTK